MEIETSEIVLAANRIVDPVEGDIGIQGEVQSQNIISGFNKEWIAFLMRINIVWLIFKKFKNPVHCFRILCALDKQRRRFFGEHRYVKVVEVNKKYFWELFLPHWPSKAFNEFVKTQINRVSPIAGNENWFTNIFIAITKKCTLQCEHCFEWDSLNGKEKLTLQDLKSIVNTFQNKGTGQFLLSGGEPMLRVNDIVEVLNSAKHDESDFWILTSGYKLTLNNAMKLKNAGLTGVFISLDHFEPELHNLFRGSSKSYEWVERAVKNSVQSKLVVALSICVTKSFVTEVNLMKYAELAKQMGVSFIQILEPKAVGHYKDKEIALNKEHENVLEAFYLKMNYDKKYRHYPLVSYNAYHQRRVGCTASGKRILYVDTNGDLHPCPFCHSNSGSALGNDVDLSIERLRSTGCQIYK